MNEEQERGASSIEYSLLIALVAAAIYGAVALIGPALVPGLQTAVAGFTP